MKGSILTKVVLTATAVAVAAVAYTGTAVAGSDTGSQRAAEVSMETVKQNYLAGVRLEAVRTHNEAETRTVSAGAPSMWLTRVEAGDVDMVTNRLDKAARTTVEIEGRSYNVSGEMGAWTLKQNASVRFARDPMTDKLIDKSSAAAFADASGRVFYFESEASLKGFLALGERSTAYGYSKP